jgi:hypothetical protein
MSRVIPRSLPSDATKRERLTFTRHWVILGIVLGLPVWALVLFWVPGTSTWIAFVVVHGLSLLNLASVSWRLRTTRRA